MLDFPIEDSEGTRARAATYNDFFRQGYTFRTNCQRGTEREVAERYQDRGFRTVVHDQAFGENGDRVSDMVAILVCESK